MKTMNSTGLLRCLGLLLASVSVLLMPAPALAIKAEGQVFVRADEAAEAFVAALKSQDVARVLAVLGGSAHDWLLTGDMPGDMRKWSEFVAAYDTAHRLKPISLERQQLIVGKNDYPFPVPLSKVAGGWQFDDVAGREEIINRRVGANELGTIEALRQIVLAQEEFVLRERTDRSAPTYAGRILSTTGKRDGLFWPTAAGEQPSPLGPLMAQAAGDGYRRGDPYLGYHYRMLPGQGKAARDGARSYSVNGRQIGGFAVLAWPARYGATGVKSFMVNQDGQVFERDLGPDTTRVAEAMKLFDPVKGWQPVSLKVGP